MPEPQGRGTWSILWGCLATIFICTWSALYLDVPKKHGRWYLLLRKLRYMSITVLAPEITLFLAAENFFKAYGLFKQCVSIEKQQWTLTYWQFANACGFRDRETKRTCSAQEIMEYIKEVRDLGVLMSWYVLVVDLRNMSYTRCVRESDLRVINAYVTLAVLTLEL